MLNCEKCERDPVFIAARRDTVKYVLYPYDIAILCG